MMIYYLFELKFLEKSVMVLEVFVNVAQTVIQL